MVSTFDCFSILVSCAIIQSYWTVGCCLNDVQARLGCSIFSMHKVPQHMQTAIALQHITVELHYARSSGKIPRQSGDA